MKLLKELHRESKAQEDWLVTWVQAYCRLSHSRARAQRRPEQLCTALRTASLLGASCFPGGALCDLMNCCWPGSSVRGLFQARMGGLTFLTLGDLPKIRMKTLVSFIGKCISYYYTI